MDVASKLQRELKSFQGVWPGGYFGGGSNDDLRNFNATFDQCLRPFAPGSTILEIGPGRGYWTKRIVDLAPQRIHCLDALSAEANQFWQHVGHEHRDLIEYHQVIDFECCEIPDQSIDLLFSYDVFCHISLTGIDAYLRRLRAKLKRGAHGFVMIADADKYRRCCPNSDFVQPTDGQHPDSYDGPASPGRWYWVGVQRFCELLARHGYRVINQDMHLNPRDPICEFTIDDHASRDGLLREPALPQHRGRGEGATVVARSEIAPARKHLIMLPFSNEEEAARLTRLVTHLAGLPCPRAEYEFMLAASAEMTPSKLLRTACAAVAPTVSFCGSTNVAPRGDSLLALFWDAMDYVNANYEHDGGFAMWMESDMCPVKPDWLDRLDREWRQGGDWLVLGNLVSALPEWLGGGALPQHINGGACYAKGLAAHVPFAARTSPFDCGIFESLKSARRRLRPSSQICFSAVHTLCAHFADERISVVRGLAQEKSTFVDAAIQSISAAPSIQHRTTSAHCVHARRQFRLHLSFSLFGSAHKYSHGMIQNALLARTYYPGARVRVYHDRSVTGAVLSRLQDLGCDLVDMTGSDIPGMFWRFLIQDDVEVERWGSRDADARIGPREASAVAEWIDSGRRLHIMRDHPCHRRPIHGGMFGMFGLPLNMRLEIRRWRATWDYSNDEEFLQSRILPRFRRHALVHDDFCMVGDFGLPTKTYPCPRTGDDCVGGIYDEHDRIHHGHITLLREYESTP